MTPRGLGSRVGAPVSLTLSFSCVFFFETVRTFLVRKVGDGMPFVTDVGEKKKIRDCRVCVVVCLQDE